MKVNIKNIFLAFVVLAFAACTKTPVENAPQEIVVAANAPQTKAMFTPTTFNTGGNRLRIYDFNPSGKYFDDLIGPEIQGNNYGYSNVWPFENAPHSWTVDEHKFFGWLEADANMTSNNTPESFFGSEFGFNEDTKVLTIPAKEMNLDTPQFDFLHSDIIVRDMVNAANYEPVNLEFTHLFTAVSFGAENGSDSKIEIVNFKIDKILNKRSATISFAGEQPVVTYKDAANATNFSRSSGAFTLDPNKRVNNIFTHSDAQDFLMLWPLESTHLHSTAKVEEVDGVITYPAEYKMYIKYTADGSTFEKRMNFPDAPWLAGKKYHYDIVFADKAVELNVLVKEWDYQHQDVDYTDAAVGVESTGVLKWDGSVSVIDETKKTVSIVNAQPAKGTFTIMAPLGGSWMISLSGDVNAFEVTPDNAEIDGQTAHITVKPLVSDPKRDYKVKLKFAVRRPDGRVITADEEVQPVVYTIVLPQNN